MLQTLGLAGRDHEIILCPCSQIPATVTTYTWDNDPTSSPSYLRCIVALVKQAAQLLNPIPFHASSNAALRAGMGNREGAGQWVELRNLKSHCLARSLFW